MSPEPSYTWPRQPRLTDPGLPVPPYSAATPTSGTPPPDRYAAPARTLSRAFPVRRGRTPPIILSRPASDDEGAGENPAAPSMALSGDPARGARTPTDTAAVASWLAGVVLDKPGTALDPRAPEYTPRWTFHPRESLRPLESLRPRDSFRPTYSRYLPNSERPSARPFPPREGSACTSLRERMAFTHPLDGYYHHQYNASPSHCFVMFPIPSDVSPADIRNLMEEEVGSVFSVKITDCVATVVFIHKDAFRARRRFPRVQIDGQELIQFVVPPIRRAEELAWREAIRKAAGDAGSR